MNDDEKKPVVPEGEADASSGATEHEDTKIEVKLGAKTLESQSDRFPDEGKDEGSREEGDETDTPRPQDDHDGRDADEQANAIDRELERVEGIGSADIRSEQPDLSDEESSDIEQDDHDDAFATKAVDLDPVTPSAAREAALMTAMRNQDKGKKAGSGKRNAILVLISIIAVAALAVAVYFYMQTAELSNQKAGVVSELTTVQSQNTQLKLQQAKAKEDAQKEAQETAQQSASAYRTIPELGIRFKESDATKSLIYGYAVTTTEASADSVAFSTVVLAKLVQRSGASATYPCGFTGNVPTITRYKQDVAIGTSMASKLGKKIGDAYFVYAAPTGQCAATNAADITARDTGVKAAYDSLEAIPSVQAATSKN